LYVSHFTTLPGYNKLCVGGISRKFPGGVMKTKTREIHQAAISEAPPLLKKALEKSGLSYDQIDYLIPHQTSRSSIYSGARHFSNYFKVKSGQVVCNLEKYGNTASTSHFLALYRYLQEKRFKKGDRVMLIGLASGLVIGAVIFTMNEIVERYGNKN
jgi:3-oxoacyl-[acyl-carrier-protein] synthase-3